LIEITDPGLATFNASIKILEPPPDTIMAPTPSPRVASRIYSTVHIVNYSSCYPSKLISVTDFFLFSLKILQHPE
jgi:hypothetical protein